MDGEVFVSLLDARVRLGSFRRYWNGERLHSSLGYLTPMEFLDRYRQEEQQKEREEAGQEASGNRPRKPTKSSIGEEG